MKGWFARLLVPALAWYSFTAWIPAAVIETTDGRKLIGKISAVDNAFVLTPEGAAPEQVAPAKVRRVTFSDHVESAPAPAAPVEWRGQSVGAVGVKGSFSQSNDVIQVTTTGTPKRFSDGRYCVWQPFGKQGEIVAFIPAASDVAKEGQRFRLAGIELLSNLEGTGPRVSFVYEHVGALIVQSRTSAGKEKSKHISTKGKGVWLRLVRNNLEVIPSFSRDGEAWKTLDAEIVALPDNAFAGVSVSGARAELPITVPISKVRVTSRATPAAPVKPALFTRSGSQLNGDYLGADGSVVRWAALGREWSVSLVNVSRLVFQPEATSLLKRVAAGRPGVLFANGDFVDGELLRSDRTRVTISSVLFGIRSFPVNGELIAVFVRDLPADLPPLRVTHSDGSALQAQDFSVQPAGLVLREAGLGELIFAFEALRELTR
ncbi:MAG: hypothetical protein EBS05_19720 [Proteobacteria bacterium]|nr:hypothetical protein [Pseudomonadota bacterium]